MSKEVDIFLIVDSLLCVCVCVCVCVMNRREEEGCRMLSNVDETAPPRLLQHRATKERLEGGMLLFEGMEGGEEEKRGKEWTFHENGQT